MNLAIKHYLPNGDFSIELVPVTKLDVFSWILLYNISSPVTESNQYVFRKYYSDPNSFIDLPIDNPLY